MCLAKNIRYLRKKVNLSQEDLANKLGYKSFTTIQKWESGVAEPSVLVVRKLADIFNVDMNALTTQDIEKNEARGYSSGSAALLPDVEKVARLFSQLTNENKQNALSYIEYLHNEQSKEKNIVNQII